MKFNQRKVVVICGPTASGKTGLSIEIAKKYQTEIISADSRQVFKELSIGTAKPTQEEMQGIPHHFINYLSVAEDFNASDFEQKSLEKIESLFSKNKLPIICGGSGLYIDALIKGFHPVPDVLPGVREKLLKEFEENGLTSLLSELQNIDPDYYEVADLNNSRRVIRALEVYHSTGKTYTSFQKQKLPERDFETLKIGLDISKKELYNRINIRCDEMLKNGLLDEVSANKKYKDKVALKTIGYREFFDYFDGKVTYDNAVEKFKQHSRNYAKRQITWFKRDKDVVWISPIKHEEIFEAIEKFIT